MIPLALFLLPTCAHPRAASSGGESAAASQAVPLVFTAANRGELRPCGCPGAVYGGLAKRATLLSALREELGPFGLVDAGDLLFPEGPLAESVRAAREEKARGILRVYTSLGYDVVAETPLDRRASEALRADPAYVGVEHGPGLYRTAQGQVIVVDGGAAPEEPAVLLSARPDAELADVGAQSPSVWAILSSSGEGSVSEPSVTWAGDVPVFRPTPKGKEFGILWMWAGLPVGGREMSCGPVATGTTCIGAAGRRHYRVEFRRIPRETADEPKVDALLHDAERAAAVAGSSDPWQEWEGRTYVSQGVCASCHPMEAARWEGTRHAQAWSVLNDEERQNLDCVGCHTTGYGVEGGFVSPAAAGLLVGVQCEVCHGPGLDHTYDPTRPMRQMPTPELCLGCHQWDRSRPFDFAERLPAAACTLLEEHPG